MLTIIIIISFLFFQQLQEFVIKSIYNIQQGNELYPYNNVKCQIELYKTLVCLTTNHHFKLPPPLNYTILLLTNGQSNKNQLISQICSIELSKLNAYIHPYSATLQIPVDLDDLKIQLDEKNNDKNNIAMIIEEGLSETEDLNNADERNTVSDANEIHDNKRLRLMNGSETREVLQVYKSVEDEHKTETFKQDAIDNKPVTQNTDETKSISRDTYDIEASVQSADEIKAFEQNGDDIKALTQTADETEAFIQDANESEELMQDTIETKTSADEIEVCTKDIDEIEDADDKIVLSDQETTNSHNEHMISDDENICNTFVDIVNE